MCERRWGSSTQVWSWVTNGSVPFKFLHTFLTRFENLVGFWRGVENGGHGNLVVFDWGPHNITGFRVLPATPGTFKVCKLPFVWIGLSRDGNPVCLMHLDSAHFVHPVNGKKTLKASESQPSSRPLQIPGNLGFSAGVCIDPPSETVETLMICSTLNLTLKREWVQVVESFFWC